MSGSNGHHAELIELLDALCDDRLVPEQSARLEELVLADAGARRLYLEYIDLHGSLYWDTAKGGEEAALAAPARRGSDVAGTRFRLSIPGRRWQWTSAAVGAAVLLVGMTFLITRQFYTPPQQVAVVPDAPQPDVPPNDDSASAAPRQFHPLDTIGAVAAASGRTASDAVRTDRQPVAAPNPPTAVADRGRTAGPVEFIDEQLSAGWTLAGVEPSPRAEDGEWIRRVFLDVTGKIPPAGTVESFLKDDRPDKRSLLVDRLLDDSSYVAHWTTVWTNLLIGRSETPAGVNRPALERFLRRSFANNRPWSEVVFDLVSAEGDGEENGAANFLLAHLNNEAVPATAVTARLFLGTQVQCTQCHHHPFNDARQNLFWELNSCFQQTEVERERTVDPDTGKTRQVARLVNRPLGGPIFYTDRREVMYAALPKFSGIAIDPDAGTNRRRELARLMTEGERPQIALAMVNRTWQHFFGHGFTRPVDDMGPHNQPTHPALLEQLAGDFVDSGYDVKQLIRWICNSEAYQLSSRYGATNADDDPQAGEPPLFSRMYVKPMTVEQLYDSLLVATRLDETRGSRWDDSERRRRQQWLQQFVFAYDTEENDEATTFDGTLPQALMMMNGDLVEAAVSAGGDTLLKRVAAARGSDSDKIRRLFLAALSRQPSPKELAAFRKLLREQTAASAPGDRRQAQAKGLEDLFWAVLNSSEFILVH